MKATLEAPDFSDIEEYFLSADKGLCFFGGHFKHHNMLNVDNNQFVHSDIGLNGPFERRKYPFVLFMNNLGYQNGSLYQSSKSFVRLGGYFVVYRQNCAVDMFNELVRDIAGSCTVIHQKFDPQKKTGLVVGKIS
jgi:hypothetical protein